jgi:chromosome segregation ATPase
MDYRTQKNQVQQEITALEEQLRDYYKEIGRAIYDDTGNHSSTTAKDQITRAKDADSRVQELDRQRESLEKLQNQLKELDEQERALKDRYLEVDRNMSSYYESIGQAAYDLYAKSSEIDEQFREEFSELAKNHNETQEVERELESAESGLEKQPFLEKIVARGKIALLRNRKSAKDAARPRLFRSLGARLCQSDFIDSVQDPTLKEAVKPYLELRQTREELDTEQARIEDQRQNAESSLEESLGEKRNAERELREIARERADAVNEKERALEAIGAGVDLTNPPSAVNQTCKKAREAQGTLAEKQKLAQRLDAALEADRIENELSSMRRRYSSLQQQIDDLKARQKELNSEIKSLENQKREKEQERGDPRELQPSGESSADTKSAKKQKSKQQGTKDQGSSKTGQGSSTSQGGWQTNPTEPTSTEHTGPSPQADPGQPEDRSGQQQAPSQQQGASEDD